MRVMLLAVCLLASCEMPPKGTGGGSGATDPKRDSPHHRHAVKTTELKTPDTSEAARPKHGVIVHSWGIDADILIVIDFDASTVRQKRDEGMLEKPNHDDRTQKLDSAKLAAVKAAAFAAWHEDATGPTPQATDIREDLIVIDGDEAFYLSGYPISTSIPEEKTGRPAAAKAMTAIYSVVPF